MDPKIMLWVIAFIALLVWCFQVATLADEESLIEAKSGSYRGGCGIFECTGGRDTENDECRDREDHAKAFQAFGVITVLLMSHWLIHVALAIPNISGQVMSTLGSVVTEYFKYIHLASCIGTIITWAIVAGWYEKKCNNVRWVPHKISDSYDLNWGFAFLIVNTVGEAVLTYMCWQNMHITGTSSAPM